MKANRLIQSIILFILLLGLTSCTGKASAILQDTSCAAPCWNNIEVGRTEIDQAITLLHQVPEVDLGSIKRGINYQNHTLDERVTAQFKNNKESWLEITFIEQKTTAMNFFFDEDISLTDVIKKFGEPKYLYPSAIEGDPLVYLTVQFLYPDEGICLLHEHRGFIFQVPKTYGITKATNITQIYYVDPSLPNSQIDYGCFTGGNENDLNSEKQDWKGFSDYAIP